MSLVGTLRDVLERPEVGRTLATGALVAARLGPLAWLAPILGLRSASGLVRNGVVVALTLVLTPLAMAHAAAPAPAWLPLALLREALVGSIFAVVTAVPFFALEAGGRLIDLQRGANLAEVIAPPTGEPTSALGDLALLGGLALFASLGGVRLLVGAFATSLVELPVGGLDVRSSGVLGAARTLAGAMDFAAVVAAPAAVAILVADVALGVAARTVPRISIFFVGMPLRALLGLVIAWLAIGLAMREGVDRAVVALRDAARLIH